ncbi:Plant Tudor-like RNA-binding protein [Abeliophyllum distichum]|uniref:Plant Tudor-like RNA-binding protein n=1 Tax=Abeliophyllum distichum TaxID=126358 RepID=A0ABD1Q8E4_9LAMI
MRYKRLGNVEVMNKRDTPVSWRNAKILSGNGHTYTVQYDCYPGTASKLTVERVSRKFIRPCPPMQGIENCVAGDIVEIFDGISWKLATILKVLHGYQCLVRLLGSSQELNVNRSNTRMRQTWHDDKWIVIGKGSGGCEHEKASKLSISNCYQQFNARAKSQTQKDCLITQNDSTFRESPLVSSRSLKRVSPYCSSIIEVHNEHAQKIRAIEKDDRTHRVVASTALGKVDAVAYPREILGEKYMHASFKNRYNEFNQMEKAEQNNLLGCSGVRSSESYHSHSDACSVGSCSVNDQNPNNCPSHFIPLLREVSDTLCSDAESCIDPDEVKNFPLPPKEEVEASIHCLELHAYRCTLEALYASGPLSWEQEALLTNLRIMLHISNDEHLKELKYLISAKTGTHAR